MGKVRKKNKIRHTVRSMDYDDDDMGAVPFLSETVKPSLKDVRMEKVDGKKIERRKKRRENWLKSVCVSKSYELILILFLKITGIEMCKDRKVKEKAMEERKKTVIVGDMEPLISSLPVLSARYVVTGCSYDIAGIFRLVVVK